MSKINNLKYLKEKYKTRFLTLEEVAQELGKKRESIASAICTGTFPIPSVKVGWHRRIEIERLAEYMDQLSEQAEKEFEGK